MPYMNVTEVESALIGLAAAHSSICELITLPNVSVEGRTSHAVRLGTKLANTVDAYYLTGGVHAREWGSCEILVNLAVDLCDAYAAGSGVGYGDKYFSKAQVRAALENMSILIFPCVNPDGRSYSQNTSALWRKNRNPVDSGGVASKVGIDINRNQDFLWDFKTAFDSSAISSYLASDDPSAETYHGHAAQSESETKNINYIHDTYTTIKWYVDVHSYSEDILYVWGDDESQVVDPNQNFRNPSFNHKRGVIGDAYAEYIPDADESLAIALANAFTRSLAEVRGKSYVAKPGFSLYPTSGTNDDYAYSRHYTDPTKSKAIAFTVEWGTDFQPAWIEMQEIIKDVSSGLLGLGLEALGIDSFIVSNRDTFSSYEVETELLYPEAFYAIYDGFSPIFLGLPGASPTIAFHDAGTGAIIGSMLATSTAVNMEQPGSPNTPQRVVFSFRVDFVDGTAFTSETRDIYVLAKFAGMQDIAPMHLIQQPNPYMLDGPISWLSTDVRVFQLRAGQKISSSSSVTLDDANANANAPYAYIQGLLSELKGFGNTLTPVFEDISQNEQASQLELSRTVGGVRVLNFAVAKVRYRAKAQDAVDVRVFFRTFNAMVSDLSYNTSPGANSRNYRRTTDGSVPLLGINQFFSGAGNQIVSIPYFAQKRVDTGFQSMTAQTDDWNKRTLVHAGAQEAIQYFGCWLDFNQTDAQFPTSYPNGNDGPFTGRVPIVALVRGIHQCLVAEIRYQPGAVDPIHTGATPASSSRLSQRNIAVVESDNPGTASTHVVQHTLLVKPSGTFLQRDRSLASSTPSRASSYDELIIRWNDLPPGTLANLYFPEFSADEIIELSAMRRPGLQLLSKLDANTVSCAVQDISFIPLPIRAERPSPGLLTLKLPLSVRTGTEFKIDVEQHSGPVFGSTVGGRGAFAAPNATDHVVASFRKILGAFRITVAVKEGEPLLQKAVRNLAVLKYIFDAIPANDSWHPVFVRYIGQLADQVKGLGVDPSLILASVDDPGLPGDDSGMEHDTFTGKVSKLIYNCFGDFEGFVLESCCDSRHFTSKEEGVAALLLTACKDRLLLRVRLQIGSKNHVCEIVVICGNNNEP